MSGTFEHSGKFYQIGKCVMKDEVEAVRLYKLAADHGYAAAQYELGTFFLNLAHCSCTKCRYSDSSVFFEFKGYN